jgi:hypothetical protein
MRKSKSTLQANDVDVFIIPPWNIRSTLEAAQNGDTNAQAALHCANDCAGSEPNCLECHRKLGGDNPAHVFVVAHRLGAPADSDVKVGAFCKNCIDFESFKAVVDRHLAKLGVEPAEQTLQ